MKKLEEAGRFPATVKTADFGESENGTQFIKFEFYTTEPEGFTIYGFLYLTDKSLENTVRNLRDAFGFEGDFETFISQVTGKHCSITVEYEEYKGVDKLKVKWINSPRKSKPITDHASFLKSLTAKAARIPAKSGGGKVMDENSPF